MKISAEVREFAKANPQPFAPSEVEGRSEGAADPEQSMAEMAKNYARRRLDIRGD